MRLLQELSNQKGNLIKFSGESQDGNRILVEEFVNGYLNTEYWLDHQVAQKIAIDLIRKGWLIR